MLFLLPSSLPSPFQDSLKILLPACKNIARFSLEQSHFRISERLLRWSKGVWENSGWLAWKIKNNSCNITYLQRSPHIKAWLDNKAAVLDKRVVFSVWSQLAKFSSGTASQTHDGNSKEKGVKHTKKRIKLNIKTEKRFSLTTSGKKMKMFWCAEEAVMVMRALWVALALYTGEPQWPELEAVSDRRGFPNIFPKSPEGSWHLLHLLLKNHQSQEQMIIHSQSREEHSKLGLSWELWSLHA